MSIFSRLGRMFDDPPKKRAKRGRKFTFHGSFKSKQEAVRKEREVSGFIVERKGRYVVMTENR